MRAVYAFIKRTCKFPIGQALDGIGDKFEALQTHIFG
jgi:hypothetical protein